MNLPRVTKIILIVVFGLLVSCGSNPEPVIPVPDSLNELVNANGTSDSDAGFYHDLSSKRVGWQNNS